MQKLVDIVDKMITVGGPVVAVSEKLGMIVTSRGNKLILWNSDGYEIGSRIGPYKLTTLEEATHAAYTWFAEIRQETDQENRLAK